MEHWRFILFFAAAFISITPAQWNNDGSHLPQPNYVNMPQPNYVNMPQPNAANMPQPYGANMPQPYDASYSEPLEVDSCEFYAKENAKAHHTEKYDLVHEKDPSPVLRRGQPFEMTIVFRRLFKIDSDSVTLELTLGSKKMKKRGRPVFLPVTSKKGFTHDPSNWDISLSSNSKPSRRLTVQIQIPYTAAVGLWRMKVISKVSRGNQPKKHDCDNDVYILFNPWSKGDLIYMADDRGRQEYVLNDGGDLYTSMGKKGMPWNFAQFHKTVLPATIFVLEKAQSLDKPYLDFASRGDPIKVVSAISAMVNGEDENGVLEGNWSGDYEGGTHPSEWTGSEPILKEYVLSGGTPVKYGQCWVFSALSTTICRTLGLPCRSVTNFQSALDRSGDLVVTTNKYPNGSETVNSESVWNFHVWNECWMTRPDLKPEYSGWQAFDGTAELRDKEEIFRAGPASVLAIRRGEIDIVYNSQVFFAAANSDRHYYNIDAQNNKALSSKDTRSIGKQILTKKPGSDKPDDITSTYKPQEGTPEERKIYNFARAKIGRSSRFLVNPTQRKGKADVCFTLRQIPKVMIGKKFKMFVDVSNNSDKKRTISFTASINSAFYNGVIAKKVKSDTGKLVLRPWQRKTLVFEVGPNIYLDKLVEFCYLRAYALARVLETNQTWATENSFQFGKPPLQIEYEDEAVRPRLFQALKISFSFTNPLKITLKECAIIIEGLGLVEFSKTKLGDLGPGEALTHVATVTPTKVGSHRLIAIFTSQLMAAVLGSKKVEVEAV